MAFGLKRVELHRLLMTPSGTTNSGVYQPQKSYLLSLNTECIMTWQLHIEEFGPTIEYIKGPKNIVANVFNRLDWYLCPVMSKTWQIVMGLIRMIYKVMLSQSPINLSIMNKKEKIKLFLLPLRVQSTICLKSFVGATDPQNYYVIKIGS